MILKEEWIEVLRSVQILKKEFVKYVVNNDVTDLWVRYVDKKDNTYKEIKVPKGTKKLKKTFQGTY